MSCGCDQSLCDINQLQARHGKVLKTVFGINLVMFLVEFSAGLLSRSSALLGDSLDMLGDSIAYGISLAVISRGARWHAAAALFKGLIMLSFGIFVVIDAVFKLQQTTLPNALTIGAIGVLALLANSVCFYLLWRHRSDNLNMRSIWLCSRNDLFANAGVILAAVLVYWTESLLPDLVIGGIIAVLFITSALGVLRASLNGLRKRAD